MMQRTDPVILFLRFIGFSALLTGLLGCKKDSGIKSQTFESRNMARATNEAEIPTALWDKIAEGASDDTTEFVPLKVFLVEKNRGILGGKNHELNYGEGGGELDLSEFVQDKSGSFYIGMELPAVESEEAPTLHVYFLSGSKRRKIGNEAYGSGCNAYFDITSFFNKAMAQDGILVNTTRQRHVSSLAGTYILASTLKSHLRVSQLTIKDSHYRDLQCPPRLPRAEAGE